MKKIFSILLILLNITIFGESENCDIKAPTPEKMIKILDFSSKVIDRLNKENINVAFISRKGSEEEYGVDYTHSGFIFKINGEWEIVHLLNQCKSTVPYLYKTGVAQFFSDVVKNDTLILIPSKNLSEKIMKSYKRGDFPKFLGDKYNLVSNPWRNEYQNCNHFLLQAFSNAYVDGKFNTRQETTNWYDSKNFKPHELEINGLKKSMMSLVSDTIILEPGQRSKNVQVVTVRSLYEFIKKLDPEAKLIEIKTGK